MGTVSTTELPFGAGLQQLRASTQLLSSWALFAKRGTDLTMSAVALAVLAPLMFALACAIKLGSKGPAFYCSQRVGKDGRRFLFYKFRTMVQDADLFKGQLRQASENERVGPLFKLADDPRITPFGRWLRRYSLDELPQLWNVLRGDMSLVGPRPHAIEDFGLYSPEHLQRLAVVPGITGLWQVKARRDPSFETNMALDLEYIERWSIWLDLKILVLTVVEVAKGRGC